MREEHEKNNYFTDYDVADDGVWHKRQKQY